MYKSIGQTNAGPPNKSGKACIRCITTARKSDRVAVALTSPVVLNASQGALCNLIMVNVIYISPAYSAMLAKATPTRGIQSEYTDGQSFSRLIRES